MNALALLLIIGITPPGAPRILPPGAPTVPAPTPAVKPPAAGVEQVRALVVVLSLPGCAPCERVKRNLAPLKARDDVEYRIEDLRAWNERVEPKLRASAAPTLFVWPDESKPAFSRSVGVVSLRQVLELIGAEGAADRDRSVVVSAPRYNVRWGVGDFDGDGRDGTRRDYEIHLRWHGVDPTGMSFEEMQRAHDAAHARGNVPKPRIVLRRG